MVLNIREPSLPYILHGKFGLFTGYIFAINSIIGAGFLSIPWAFANAGWLFTLILQIFVTIQSYYLSFLLLEAMSRAEILFRMTEEGKDIHRIPFKKLFTKPTTDEQLIQPPHLKPIITNRIIGCTEIMKLAFGDKHAKFYFIVLSISQIGTLVAYISIFSSSFASNVPIGTLDTCDIYSTDSFYNDCRWKYWAYLLIFGVITIYLTVRGIEEQQSVQISMAILRFLVIFLLCATCIANIALHQHNESDKYNPVTWPPLINLKNAGFAIPIILFAFNYQLQIPTISMPINNKPRNLPLISTLTVISCFILYTLIGLLVSIGIANVPSVASLSYRNYSAGHQESDRPFWTYIIGYIVIIVPTLDVLSAYPIQALTLSDAIAEWKYGAEITNVPKKFLYISRFFIALIPFLIAFFEFDLGQILDWAGFAGALLVQIAVPLMHLALRHMVSGASSYDVKISVIASWSIILSNAVLLIIVIVLNIIY